MRLIPEAIRDVLLFIEQNLQLKDNGSAGFESNIITQNELASELAPSKYYSESDIIYTVQQLVEHKFLVAKVATGKNGRWIYCEIKDITWEGHEFLNSVRSDTVWIKTKEHAQKIGVNALKELVYIANKITRELIENSIQTDALSDLISNK